MSSLEFTKDELNGEEVFRLDGGTKYLSTLYIKHNKHWDSWMVFDYSSKTPITNRIFKTQEDCIHYISTYDALSERALESLHQELTEPTLLSVMQTIDFANPKPIAQVMDSDMHEIIEAQKHKISTNYQSKLEEIQLIYTFFEGLMSLFVEKHNDKGDHVFYIFNNGMVSDYPSWKTVSVAMALFNQLIDYNKEQEKQKALQKWRDGFIGKSLIDSHGIGLAFGRHIESTNLVYLQKVAVTEKDGVKIANPDLPLTPMFVCELTATNRRLNLAVKSINKHISVMDETFIIELDESNNKDRF